VAAGAPATTAGDRNFAPSNSEARAAAPRDGPKRPRERPHEHSNLAAATSQVAVVVPPNSDICVQNRRLRLVVGAH
jgi:hypothetical protein